MALEFAAWEKNELNKSMVDLSSVIPKHLRITRSEPNEGVVRRPLESGKPSLWTHIEKRR